MVEGILRNGCLTHYGEWEEVPARRPAAENRILLVKSEPWQAWKRRRRAAARAQEQWEEQERERRRARDEAEQSHWEKHAPADTEIVPQLKPPAELPADLRQRAQMLLETGRHLCSTAHFARPLGDDVMHRACLALSHPDIPRWGFNCATLTQIDTAVVDMNGETVSQQRHFVAGTQIADAAAMLEAYGLLLEAKQ
jgi:hypothetical protein